MALEIRTLDRPTPAVRGVTMLGLAIAAWALCLVAYLVGVAIVLSVAS